MIRPFHSRTAAFTRCTAALAAASFSLSTLAQTATSPAPQPPTPAAAAQITPSLPRPNKRQAEAAYLTGARLLDRKDFAGAEAEFTRATALDPDNRDYAQALASTQEHRVTDLIQQAGKARLLGQSDKAETLLAEARRLNPQGTISTQISDPGVQSRLFHPEIEPWLKEGPSIAGPITLTPDPVQKSFHLHTDQQAVVQNVISAYGIHPVFDSSVERKDFRFELEEGSYQQTVPVLLNMLHLFAVPLDAKSVFIAADTEENRQRLEHLLQETIYIPGMASDEMDQFANAIRSIFDLTNKQVLEEKSSGALVVRAPEDVLTYINLTLADLIDGGGQVMIDLKLYSVDRTNQRNIGTQLPQQVGLYSVSAAAQSIVSANQTLVNQAISQGLVPANASNLIIALALIASGLVQSSLLTSTVGVIGGGISQFGITNNQNPTLNLALNASDTHALNDLQLRVGDGQTAVFRLGEKYPITTSVYSSGVTGAAGIPNTSINGVSVSSLLNTSLSSVTVPQIQYEDIGLTLEAKPIIQKSGSIKMEIKLKIESLAGGSLNNIPILNSDVFTSDVTVPDGDTALIASTLSRSQAAAINGEPGIGNLPGFQSVLSDKTTNVSSSELLLLVTPHIVRRRSSESAGPRIAVNLPGVN